MVSCVASHHKMSPYSKPNLLEMQMCRSGTRLTRSDSVVSLLGSSEPDPSLNVSTPST